MSKLSTYRNPEHSKSLRFFGNLCTLAVLLCAAQRQEESWEKLNAEASNLRRQKRYADALSEGQRGLALAELTEIGQGIWWAHQDSNLGPTDYESAALTN